MTPIKPTARLLMCRPEHFAVSYTINPWMEPDAWARDASIHSAAAHREWTALYRTFQELGAAIDLVPAAPGVPDLVFTANAAVVLDRKVLLARFRHRERQAEEPYFEAAFHALKARGLIDSVRRCRTASCSKAPATACSTRPATCSGWATASAPTRPRSAPSRTRSASR